MLPPSGVKFETGGAGGAISGDCRPDLGFGPRRLPAQHPRPTGVPAVSAGVVGDVEIPNDISGVVYVPLDSHGAWHLSVAKELRNAGYSVDMNKII